MLRARAAARQHAMATRQVLLDCGKAMDLCPAWSKLYFRMGTAHLALGSWDAAMQACRTGESLLGSKVRQSKRRASLSRNWRQASTDMHGSHMHMVPCHEGASLLLVSLSAALLTADSMH